MPRSRASTQVSLPAIRDVFPEHFNTAPTGLPRDTQALRETRPAPESIHGAAEVNHARKRAGSVNSPSHRHHHQPYPPTNPHAFTSAHPPPLSRVGSDGQTSPSQGSPISPRGGRSADNEKRHGCHICGRAFNRPSSLAIHMNSHTGDRPFICPVCGQAFSVNSNMKRHLRTHKPGATEAITPPFSNTILPHASHIAPMYKTSPPFACSTSGSPPSLHSVSQDFSDSDSDDSVELSSPFLDPREDRGMEETRVSFARVTLGPYSRDNHSRRMTGHTR